MQQPAFKGTLFFRFASESTLREFSFPLPSRAGDVRAQLKLNLSISSPLDVLVYRLLDDGKSSRNALSDSAVLVEGQKLLIKRVPESLARSILSAALDAEARERKVAEELSVKLSNVDPLEGLEAVSDSDESVDDDVPEFPSDAPSESSAPSEPSSELQVCTPVSTEPDDVYIPTELSEEDEDEMEQVLIQRVMDQQVGSHRSDKQPTLASRYYRGRNLTWSRDSDSNNPTPDSSTTYGNSSYGRFNTFNRFDQRGGRGGGRPVQPIVSVKESYVCHICGEKGHHIRNCPKGHDPKRQKKVKPSTGLPRSWLQRIPDDRVAESECDVYSLPGWEIIIIA